MYEIKELTKDYKLFKGKFRALSSISLKLPNEGLIALFGENGCGKTTLLNAISSLDTKYSGTILFNGKDIKDNLEVYRKDVVSFVLQDNLFSDYLNVKENILLFLGDNDEQKVSSDLLGFNILDKENEKPQNLSGGQKQRVSLIRGLSKKHRVLLVDEPTSSLNEQMELEVFRKLKILSKESLVILVSHNKALIRQYSDMILHMENGRIINIEKNNSQEIDYYGNEVRFPRQLTSFAFVDINIVKTIVDKDGKAIFSYSEGKENGYCPDYEIKENTSDNRKKTLPIALRKQIFTKSIKKSASALIFGCILISIFAFLLSLVSSFAVFDPYAFMFDSLQSNYNERIDFNKTVFTWDGAFFATTKQFNLSSYSFLTSKFDSDIIFRRKGIDCIDISIESCGIYSNVISSILYCRENSIDLLTGQFSEIGEIMISDYLADGIIAASAYNQSYSDILSNGIEINGIRQIVSGIVDTDYESYLLGDVGTLEVKNKPEEFIRKKTQLWEAVYCSFNNPQNSQYITMVPTLFESLYPTIATVNTINVDRTLNCGECLINKKTEECLAAMGIDSESYVSFKIDSGQIVSVGVVDDGENYCKIYVNEDDFNEEIKSVISEKATVLINLKNVNELKELHTHSMCHDMPSSESIYDTIFIIEKLNKSLVKIIIACCSLVFIITLMAYNRIISFDLQTVALIKMNGFADSECFRLFSLKMKCLTIISSLISIGLYCINSILMNKIISTIFKVEIHLFRFNWISVLICVGCIFVSGTVSLILVWLINNKKDVINLLKN